MAKDFIGYEALTEAALRSVVREALRRVEKKGLLGNHHFFLSFKTHDPGVDIPDFLKERYPDEMTIVLQNQYSGLTVTDDAFEVTLSFQKLPTTLFVPFAALTGFVDPSVQFGLQFKNAATAQAPQAVEKLGPKPVEVPPAVLGTPKETPREQQAPAAPTQPQVVSLDKFRKK
jgi:hypothetical protein